MLFMRLEVCFFTRDRDFIFYAIQKRKQLGWRKKPDPTLRLADVPRGRGGFSAHHFTGSSAVEKMVITSNSEVTGTYM